jgi:nicotinate-nucleotide adenylyltransferase
VSTKTSAHLPELDWSSLQGPVVLFGGTFDPPQSAHLEIARRGVERLGSKDVNLIFVPARLNPHKSSVPHAADVDRLAMLARAIGGTKNWAVSPIELMRQLPGPSFTVDTVREVRARIGIGQKLFLLMGGDSLMSFPRWRMPNEILEMVDGILVAPRTPEDRAEIERLAREFGHALASKVLEFILPGAPIDISATFVRERLVQGLSVTGLVPSGVEIYIRDRGLYLRNL